MPNLFFIKDIKKSNSSCNSFDGKKKYVATADLQNGKIVNYEVVDFNSKPSRANLIADKGSVIFAKLQNTIKVLVIDDSNVDNIYSTGFYSFKDERVLPSYMKFFFESTLFNTIKDKNCQGATMKAVNDEGMSKISINVPTIHIQQIIINELSKITELINFNKNYLVNLDNIVKSQFIEMFGDPINNEKKWNQEQLANVCKVINGRAYKDSELLDSGKYRVLRVGNFFTNNSWYYSDLELPEDKYCEYGDLLFAWSASFGPRIWRGEKVIYHYHIWKLSNYEEKINKVFFMEHLNYQVEELRNNTHGSTMQHFTKADMEKQMLVIPPIELQNKYADFVQQIDKSKYFGGVNYAIC